MTDVTGTTPSKSFKQRHKFGKHGLSIKKKDSSTHDSFFYVG